MSVRAEKLLVTVGLVAIVGGGFFAIAHWAVKHAIEPPGWLSTRTDQALPLIVPFVWVYLSWYPATALVLLTEQATFRRAYVSYLLAFALCAIGYLCFPVTIQRASVDPDLTLSHRAIVALYTLDPPTNLFPSFHAAVAAILMHLQPPSRLMRIGLPSWMTAICGSCVLTKQHYILDVIAGLAVGIMAMQTATILLQWRPAPAPRYPQGSRCCGDRAALAPPSRLQSREYGRSRYAE